MLQNKKDKEATKARKFMNPKSYVSSRIHPETSHPCQYLKGKDVEIVRMVIFEREKGRCFNCGAYYGWDYGEMHHKLGGLGPQRCFCEENLTWSCRRCHTNAHARILQWRNHEKRTDL
jgi:hypothetical protein